MGTWQKGTSGGSPTNLTALSDTSISSPSVGQVLKYNGLRWVNGDDATQSGSSSPSNSLINDLNNPFKKTRIKCVGDSITDGVGATGYVTRGYYGWVKTLNDLVTTQFNREWLVGLNDSNITITSTKSFVVLASTLFPTVCRIDNTSDNGKGINFSFYGDHFALYYVTFNQGAIAEVWVDGVKHGDVDTYSASIAYQVIYNVTGLSLGTHSVEIRETARKNASSTGFSLIFDAVKIPKTATVINAGNSGQSSKFVYDNMAGATDTSNISATDDIIILQIGTNDPNSFVKDISKWYVTEVVKYAQSLNKKIVICCANPLSATTDNGGSKKFKMHELNLLLGQIAEKFSLPFISNYDAFIEYAQNTGVTIDSLLADGIHPNDTGYKVMSNNILRKIGLTLTRDGVTY